MTQHPDTNSVDRKDMIERLNDNRTDLLNNQQCEDWKLLIEQSLADINGALIVLLGGKLND